MKLKQYPKYKESVLPWIEKIPEHWDVLPNRAVFEERNTRGMIDEDLLSVTIKRGVIRQKELIESSSKKDSSNEDKSKYKLVIEGDLPYNKMRMWQGAVGVSKYRGIVSPAYIILKPRENAHSNYFHYLLRTTEYTKESHRYSYGICDDQLSLRFKDFKVIKSIVPSLDEQRKIASFLRVKEKEIAQFSRNKRRLIQLLKEQKQAIINQAVTRGIDHDVKLKPSGIDWVGEVPEHWEIQRLKYIVLINKNVLSESMDKNYEFSYIDIGSVGTGYIVNEPEKIRFKNAPSRARRIPHSGDTIISTVRTYLRAVFYFDKEIEDLICSTGFAVLTPNLKITPSLLGLLIQSDNFINLVVKESIGVSYPAISETKLSTLKIAYPPARKEQEDLVRDLNNKTKDIDNLIKKAQREIDLIQEYRTRLISDVVTGKVDVRDIKVEDIDDEELADVLDSSEEITELEDSVDEVLDED